MLRRLCAIIAVSTATVAQTSVHGSLSGRVTDPSDAAIVQAKVTLASVGGGLSFTATSGEDGLYQFSRVAPGRYVLTFEDPQFARTVLDDVAIAVNEQALDVPQTALNSALFGQVTSTMPGFGPRQMQFAMKLTF